MWGRYTKTQALESTNIICSHLKTVFSAKITIKTCPKCVIFEEYSKYRQERCGLRFLALLRAAISNIKAITGIARKFDWERPKIKKILVTFFGDVFEDVITMT